MRTFTKQQQKYEESEFDMFLYGICARTKYAYFPQIMFSYLPRIVECQVQRCMITVVDPKKVYSSNLDFKIYLN